MSTLPIGSVTLKHIIDKLGNDFDINCGSTHVNIVHDDGVFRIYISDSNENWQLSLEVNPDNTTYLHRCSTINPEFKKALPFFDYSNDSSIKEDFLETVYALLHYYLDNPLHNSRGQVRRKTLKLINDSILMAEMPKQSLAIWYKIARIWGLHSPGLKGLYYGVINNRYPKAWRVPYYTVVNGITSSIYSYVLYNLGYHDTDTTTGWTTENPRENTGIPSKYLRVMNYSTRVPNELGFKVVEDKKGKFDAKFKKYYEEYVAFINSNSTSEYNPLAPVYLGLELEYEVDEDYNRDGVVAEIVMPKLYPHGICKSDGSLDYGIELVTVPAVYDEHVKALSNLFDDFPEELFTDDTCGLHIHLSRKPFNLPTQGRMIAFMNNPYNAEFLKEVGGRDFNRYSHQDASRSVSSVLKGGGERYNVLNLNNSATLEFRLFQGTTDFTKIKRSMQFCLALAEYCKNLTMPVKEFTKHDNFTKWLSTQRKVYPELTDFLSPRKPIPQEYRKNVSQNI